MNKNTLKISYINFSLLLLLTLVWNQAQSCEMLQDDSGRTIYRDCYIDNKIELKMPNLQVQSADISIYPGTRTGLDISFDIINAGDADSDTGSLQTMSTYNNGYGSFNVQSTVYAVSEDHSFNLHYDNYTSQLVTYSQQTDRINKLVAGDTQTYNFSNSYGPRYSLYNRDITYKIGLIIEVDEPDQTSSSTQGQSHGEVIESNESDNGRSVECLLYSDNIRDLSEIMHIEHFHISNDLELPLVGPC